MTTVIRPRGPGRPRTEPPKVLVPVKMTPDQRQRFKVACAEEDLSYAELVIKFLDDRDRRRAASQRAQAHPLHQPVAKSHYPSGSAMPGGAR